jgi:hypothetical protein
MQNKLKDKLHTITPRRYAGGLVVLMIVAVGLYLTLGSHASTPYASINADSGTLANGAATQTCSGASDGSCVAFDGNSSAATVGTTPDGPAAPTGGWSLEYGDAFNDPICTSTSGSCSAGQDNTWFPNRSNTTCNNVAGDNTQDDPQAFNCNHVSVDSSGLNLTCTYTPGVANFANYPPSNYTCGYLDGVETVTNEKNFEWKDNGGQEWAFQVVAKYPQNTGEADSSFWSWGPTTRAAGSYSEIDFYEDFGSSAGPGGSWTQANTTTKEPDGSTSNGHILFTDPTWITGSDIEIQAENDFESYCQALSCQSTYGYLGYDPSAAYHTYTTVIFPNNTMSEYIDGQLESWEYIPDGGTAFHGPGGTVIGPPASINDTTMGLILEYGLRDDTDGDPDPYFTSGTRDYNVRSVSVYENTTANGADTVNPGLAPGTTSK